MDFRLVVVTGYDRGKGFPLPEGRVLTIGRSRDQDISLTGQYVRRHHCQAGADRQGAWVRGPEREFYYVAVNGQPMRQGEVRPVKWCDVIIVGDDQLRVEGPPGLIDLSWVRSNDGTAFCLARSIHYDKRFTDLPILGDALEDAGCTDPDILGHCRSGGDHVRGCWVVDRLLGKR
jgi:hypothetical protein